MCVSRNPTKSAIKKENVDSVKNPKQPMRDSNTINNAVNIASQKSAPSASSFASIVAAKPKGKVSASASIVSNPVKNVEVTEGAN